MSFWTVSANAFTPLLGHPTRKYGDEWNEELEGQIFESHERKSLVTGFTLIELLIIVALFTITGLVITNIFLGHSSLYRFTTAEVSAGVTARLAADRMAALIREANSALSSRVFSGTTYTSGPEQLVLRLKTVDSSNEFVAGVYDYVVFYRNPTDLERLMETVEASASSRRFSGTRILADNIRDFKLVYDSADFSAVEKIELQIVAAEDFRPSTATTTVRTGVKLRNKN